MIYLLDTCTLSDFVKGHPQVMARLKATPPDDIALSSVTLMELEYGLLLNPHRAAKLRPMIEALLSRMTSLPFHPQPLAVRLVPSWDGVDRKSSLALLAGSYA